MSISERDAVLRERAAYAKGCANRMLAVDRFTWNLAAEKAYPLPKVERQRRVRDPEELRATWYNDPTGGITLSGGPTREYWPTAARVAVWADLLARPTELVEDDGQ